MVVADPVGEVSSVAERYVIQKQEEVRQADAAALRLHVYDATYLPPATHGLLLLQADNDHLTRRHTRLRE